MTPENQYYSEVGHLFNANHKKHPQKFNMTSYHYHNVYEIHYLINGERKLFYKDRLYYISAGDMILIDKFSLHSLCDWDKPGYEGILLDFRSEFFDDIHISDIDILSCFKQDVAVMALNEEHRRLVLDRFLDIVKEFDEKNENYEICLRAKMIDLLIFIDRLTKLYEDKTEMPSPKHNTVSGIMAYIDENAGESLSLESIAQKFGYSRNYLSTLFKQVSGFSIVDYINGVRVKKSQTLLKETDKTVTEIAELTGFGSITHFGRIFKQIAGVSPLGYRKKVK